MIQCITVVSNSIYNLYRLLDIKVSHYTLTNQRKTSLNDTLGTLKQNDLALKMIQAKVIKVHTLYKGLKAFTPI